MRDWVTNVGDTYYLLGSALGPHPYPVMVREFQSIIGREARAQILDSEGRLPDALVACVGGGSNSIGLFHPFLGDAGVRMIGVEAGGMGEELGQHAARFKRAGGGRPGVLQGTLSYVLQDEDGQIASTHSISAGLDYPSIGPEHAFLHDAGRVEYTAATDVAASSRSSRRATPTSRRPARSSSNSRARARPSSSWAFHSATPSPTAPRFNAPPSARCAKASESVTFSKYSPTRGARPKCPSYSSATSTLFYSSASSGSDGKPPAWALTGYSPQ